MEKVDILLPPKFNKTGKTKTLQQAWKDEDWIGTFNLWIVRSDPIPSIIYQIRSPKSNWAPNLLDVTAGGHYQTSEDMHHGLREVEEELGKVYDFNKITHLGRKLHISPDTEGNTRHNVVDVFITIDNSSLNTYTLQKSEVFAVCECPLDDLLKVHLDKNYRFQITGLDNKGNNISRQINKESFPYNWDNYHYKIASLAKRFLNGEKNLVY